MNCKVNNDSLYEESSPEFLRRAVVFDMAASKEVESDDNDKQGMLSGAICVQGGLRRGQRVPK